ncbi:MULTISPECIES: hypothetical protein [unclassified Streptomyces]|uniref:hypothetical protein n=1 Tax=unclassified Streptomyces TaxID=2593676 RepID=UPI0004C206BD|nr:MULTISPECIES: hypothetical protein [unclassified Streptomyces]
MKMWSRKAWLLLSALALSLGTVLAAPATSASALNGVACDEDGYLRIWYTSWTSDGFEYQASYCWANAGEDDQLYVPRVTHLHSGNNAGYVIIDESRRISFGKWWSGDLSGAVTFLHID